MNFYHTAAQFFRNVADYFEPQGIHPSPSDKELRRQSQGNSSGKEWTPAEVYQNNVNYMRREHEEFDQILTDLKGKEKQPMPNS